MSYIQGTWINYDQENEIYGYKFVIEGNKFVIYNKRGKILQDKDGNEVKGTIQYCDIRYSSSESSENNNQPYYHYLIDWTGIGRGINAFHDGSVSLFFNPNTNEVETMLEIKGWHHDGGKANGYYFKET